MKSQNAFLSLGLALALTAITACTEQPNSETKRGMRELVCTTDGKETMRSQQVGYIRAPSEVGRSDDTYKFYRSYEDRYKGAIGRYRQRLGEYCVIYRVNSEPSNF